MDVLLWVSVGLVLGALAELFIPGRDRRGIVITGPLGIAGALIGGFIGSQLGLVETGLLDSSSLIAAILGALLLLLVHRAMDSH
jgi:uncharacterized membrane protein YeaQ/YmgE (transglycosylase-associated protein family)